MRSIADGGVIGLAVSCGASVCPQLTTVKATHVTAGLLPSAVMSCSVPVSSEMCPAPPGRPPRGPWPHTGLCFSRKMICVTGPEPRLAPHECGVENPVTMGNGPDWAGREEASSPGPFALGV